jgi:DNA-binding response OmpR family regulator
MSDRRRSVVAISGESQRGRMLDALLLDTNDYDVLVVESMARGYSRIKELKPDLVIVYLEIDDSAVCQLLSMLTVDSDTSTIPVLTWAARYEKGGLEDIIAVAIGGSSHQVATAPMN